MPAPADGRDPITTLRALLRTAEGLVASLAGDPLFARLVRVFSRMPEGDREIVVGVLEREVEARRAVAAGVPLTVRPVRPNPHARLYLRVSDPDDGANQTRAELAYATVRAARVIARAEAGLAEEIVAAIGEGARGLDPEEHAALAAFHREILEVLEARKP